jgi:hypothetical protein
MGLFQCCRLKELLATTLQFPSDKYFHGETPVNPPKCVHSQ